LRSLASNAFRVSIGLRRKSLPSTSSKSNAQRTAFASAPLRRIKSNTASPLSSQTIASPSIKHDPTASLPTAIAIKGKRDEKSFPARVISRTPAESFRARIRKPSCLISCNHPGPEGGGLGGGGQARFDYSQPWAGTLTQRHGHLIGISAER